MTFVLIYGHFSQCPLLYLYVFVRIMFTQKKNSVTRLSDFAGYTFRFSGRQFVGFVGFVRFMGSYKHDLEMRDREV